MTALCYHCTPQSSLSLPPHPALTAPPRARRLAPLAELVTTPLRSLQPSLTPPQQRQARYTHTPATLHSFLLPRGRPKSRTHHPLTCGCPPTRLHQPPPRPCPHQHQGRDPAPLLSVGDSGSRRLVAGCLNGWGSRALLMGSCCRGSAVRRREWRRGRGTSSLQGSCTTGK